MSGRFTGFGFSKYSARLRDSERKDPCNDCSCLNPAYPFYQDFRRALFALYFEDFQFYAYQGVDVEDIPLSSSFSDVWDFISSQDGVNYGQSTYGEATIDGGGSLLDSALNREFLSKDGSIVYRIGAETHTYSVPVNERDPDVLIDTDSNPAGEFRSFLWPFPAATLSVWHDTKQVFVMWVNSTLVRVYGKDTDSDFTVSIPEEARVTFGWMSTADSSDEGNITFGFGFLRADSPAEQFVYDIDMKLLH